MYIIKSYAYKIANFISGNIPFIVSGMKEHESSLFIGLDISHDFFGRLSSFAISAVDFSGKIIYLKKYKNLELNEKIDVDIFEKEYINSINAYKDKNGESPKEVFILRDGRFIENIDIIKNITGAGDNKYVLIEVNKNSNINSNEDLKDKMMKLDENEYLYFPKTFLNQKGVEVTIKENKTEHKNDKIAFIVMMLTKMYYGSPYTGIRLPYPIHIADKTALTDFEWRLYIPYLMT